MAEMIELEMELGNENINIFLFQKKLSRYNMHIPAPKMKLPGTVILSLNTKLCIYSSVL